MKTLDNLLSYKMGEEVWTITEKGFVEEKVWEPSTHDNAGQWQFGFWSVKKVWKETTSKPFVF